MSGSHSLLDTILDSFVPVHRDGHKFVAVGLGVTLLCFFLLPALGWIAALITIWVIYFFRDPDRVTPLRDGLIVAPADGMVSMIGTVAPPMELGMGAEPRVQVSIFLSIFDVHIQRAPIAGRVMRSVYVPGAFFNAALDKASDENERRLLVFEGADNVPVACVQIAGLIARRIVTFVEEGEPIGVGERFGLIRFGSRVDTYLPVGAIPLVSAGQRAIGGETIFADLRSTEPEREARRH